jgi:hypothetical protein
MPVLFTLGTSEHPMETFLGCLSAARVTLVIDIRRRRVGRLPYFDDGRTGQLSALLARHGIDYEPAFAQLLGGRLGNGRTLRAFRRYAATAAFAEVRARLLQCVMDPVHAGNNVVILGEERNPWRCRRSIIAASIEEEADGWYCCHLLDDPHRPGRWVSVSADGSGIQTLSWTVPHPAPTIARTPEPTQATAMTPEGPGMLVITFSNPLTSDQRATIEQATGAAIDRVIPVAIAFDDARPFAPQIDALIAEAELSAQDWPTTLLLVVIPEHSAIASVLLAHLHGLLGRFPSIVRLHRADRLDHLAVAEIIDLQGVRDAAWGGRFR